MLSKTEKIYLQGNYIPNNNYKRFLDHNIRKKLKIFYQFELPLIQNSFVSVFTNTVVSEYTNTHCSEAQTSREATKKNGLGGLRSLDL